MLSVLQWVRPALVTPLAISAGLGLGLAVGASAVAISPAAASAIGVAITSVACSSTSGCVVGTNSSTGPGVAGTSSKGTGVNGVSSSSYGLFGTSSSGVGVKGVSKTSSAMFASNSSSTYATVNAQQSGSGAALSGTATKGTAVSGQGSTGAAFHGSKEDGVDGSESDGYNGVSGVDTSSNYLGGAGVSGYSDENLGGAFVAGTLGLPLVARGATTNKGNIIFDASSSDDTQAMDFYDDGSLEISGTLHVDGGCTGCNAATHVVSYAPRESEPTIEDVGTARLLSGSAYVSLDAAFRRVIDPTAEYTVLVTPKGDSNGVFIAAQSPRGFLVRENRGGRSTLAFGYRIVAKPYGIAEPRLPLLAAHRNAPASRLLAHAARIGH